METLALGQYIAGFGVERCEGAPRWALELEGFKQSSPLAIRQLCGRLAYDVGGPKATKQSGAWRRRAIIDGPTE
jgi:hypothetical protein